MGSSTEYARSGVPLAEDAPLATRGFFGLTKAAGSLLLLATAAERGIRVAVLRAFQVYGPGDHPGRFVPTVLRAAGSGEVLPLTPPGSRRDWVWVGDVVDACVRAAADDALPAGQVLNIGTGTQTTNEDLVDVARVVTGRPIPVAVGAHPGRAWDTDNWVCDPTLARSLLGWSATVPLARGSRACGPMTPTIALIVPVYGNAATLLSLAERLAVAMTGRRWRLRFVIDASPDSSAEVATGLAARDARIATTVLTANVGQHRALERGLAAEPDADVWVCLDADLQDPPEAVPALLDRLASEDVAAVFAGRRGAYEPRLRRWSDLHRRIVAADRPPPDAGAFVALGPQARRAILQASAPSLVVALGAARLPVASVPVPRSPRPLGRSAWTAAARTRHSVRCLAWGHPATRLALPPLHDEVRRRSRKVDLLHDPQAVTPKNRVVVTEAQLTVHLPAYQPHAIRTDGRIIRRKAHVSSKPRCVTSTEVVECQG